MHDDPVTSPRSRWERVRRRGVRRPLRALRSRAFLLSAGFLLVAAAGASSAWQRDAPPGQPNPQYGVAPGTVPVASPIWTDLQASDRVVVPTQALGYFPYGSPRPARGSEYFVQVVRLASPDEQERPTYEGTVSGRTALRYEVQVKPVHIRNVAPGYAAVYELEPYDVIIPRYIYSLGSGDLVSGQAPSMREIDYPQPPPPLPVVVERAEKGAALRVEVDVPAVGYSGEVRPVHGGAAVPLKPVHGTVGRMQARLPMRDMFDIAELLAFDARPTLNVGWLVVRDVDGQVSFETPLRY